MNCLAFDLGASSGRAMLAHFDGHSLSMRELHRFSNYDLNEGGHTHWNAAKIFDEIKRGMAIARDAGGFDTVGIDTWGVDYALLDENDALLNNPFHYRDERTNGMVELAAQKFDSGALYKITGTQVLPLNTLFQLLAEQKFRQNDFECAKTLLLLPNYFNWLLCGCKAAELSIASTTQLLDTKTCDWSQKIINAFGFDRAIFQPIVKNGEKLGELRRALCEELGIEGADVISVCGHDTAGAVAAMSAADENTAFISCGTWSLLGAELQEPVLTEKSRLANLTNERGFAGCVTYLKNLAGLYLMQRTKAFLASRGENHSFAELERMARDCDCPRRIFDTEDPRFNNCQNPVELIASICKESGFDSPKTVAETVRAIYESLAAKHAEILAEVGDCCGKKFSSVCILGGGVKDKFLRELTARECGVPVIAGNEEAAALGNVFAQLIAKGEVANLSEARKIAVKNEN